MSIPTIVYLVYRFGYEVDQVIHVIKRVQFGIVGMIVGIVVFAGLKMYFSQRQEEQLEKDEEIEERKLHPDELKETEK